MKNKKYLILGLIASFLIGGWFYRDKLALAGILDTNNAGCFSKGAATTSVTHYIYVATSTATTTSSGCLINRADTVALDIIVVASSTKSRSNLVLEYSYNGGDYFTQTIAATQTGGQSIEFPLE